MTPSAFRRSVAKPRPPAGLEPALAALWWAKKGDWGKAHDIAMNTGGADCAWVHAWPHRVEGDDSNARYWYREAGRKPATDSLRAEWNSIATALLARNSTVPAHSGHKRPLRQRRTG